MEAPGCAYKIKHNVVSEESPLIISIKSNENGIVVRNPLQPKTSNASWGIGLENIKNRYASFDKEVSFQASDTEFIVNIPYLN